MAGSDSNRSLSSGVFRNFLGNIVGPLAGLASAPILAQSLGVDGRGFVAGATAPFLLITTIATLGIPEAMTYFIARSPHAVRWIRSRGILLIVVAGLIATLISVAAAPLMAIDSPGLAPLIMVASLAVVPTIVVAAMRGSAAGLGLWGLVAIERAVGPLVRLGAVAALAISGNLTVTTASIAIAFAPILGGIVYFRLPRPGVSSTARADAARMTAILSYGYRVWFGSIAGVLLMRVDQVLMVPLASTFELGLYVVAVTVSELPLVVNTAVREVVFASDARSSENGRLTAAARASFFVCGAMAVVLASTAFWWIPIVFGAGFAAAVPTTAVLLAAVAIGVPGSVAGAGLSSRGLPHLRSISLVIACIVNFALLLILVPAFGALGAALSTLVGNVISSNVNVIQMRRRFGVPVSSFYLVRASDISGLYRAGMTIIRKPRNSG